MQVRKIARKLGATVVNETPGGGRPVIIEGAEAMDRIFRAKD